MTMPRFRLLPTPDQEVGLLEHARHARFIWNLAVEQHKHWRPGGAPAPNYYEQARQLTEARAEFDWLRTGSQMVQQQALRDFAQAMSNFFRGSHRRPTWRKAGQHEGFRQVNVQPEHVQRLNRRTGRIWVAKIGWVRFRWSRSVPSGIKSFRVGRDRAGRWHVVLVVIPEPIAAPGNGEVVGVDRGVTVSAALSTGELLHCGTLTAREERRLAVLRRKLTRAERGSNRRGRVKRAIARLKVREADRRRDWIEKTTTNLARRFDLIRVEDLDVKAMTRSARRVERVNPVFTSQTCSACGHRAPENRKSQAVFRCVACGHQSNADVNAARNIAAGRAVTARRGRVLAGPANREPQLATSSPG